MMGYFYDDEDNAPMCENCIEYSHILGACMKDWNNLDPIYYNRDRDERKPDETCDEWRKEP